MLELETQVEFQDTLFCDAHSFRLETGPDPNISKVLSKSLQLRNGHSPKSLISGIHECPDKLKTNLNRVTNFLNRFHFDQIFIPERLDK